MLRYFYLASGFEVCPCCVHEEFVPFSFWLVFCCYLVHQLMDVWVVAAFWILRVILLCTFLYTFLCRPIFSFLLGLSLGVENAGSYGNCV